MTTIKRIFLYFIIALLPFVSFAFGGSPRSMYDGNELLYNPAYAGATNFMNFNLSARKSWIKIPGSPSTISLNIHTPLPMENHAVGLLVQQEFFGIEGFTYAYGDYAYRFFFPSNQSELSIGLQAGIVSQMTNWDKIAYVENPEDPALGTGCDFSTRFDANLGVYYQSKYFSLGLAANHLPQAKFSKLDIHGESYFSRMKMDFYFTGEGYIPLNEEWALVPRFLMHYKPIEPVDFSVGVHAQYKKLLDFGTSWQRGQNAISLMASVKVYSNLDNDFYIGYNYTAYIGLISPLQQGSHEIMLRYDLKPTFLRYHKYAHYRR